MDLAEELGQLDLSLALTLGVGAAPDLAAVLDRECDADLEAAVLALTDLTPTVGSSPGHRIVLPDGVLRPLRTPTLTPTANQVRVHHRPISERIPSSRQGCCWGRQIRQ